jgi:transposase
VVIAGIERKGHFFAMDLPRLDACFLKAYPAETGEAFCDGHVAAFAFFGGKQSKFEIDESCKLPSHSYCQ